jgi:predicted nucleotidyltransferase
MSLLEEIRSKKVQLLQIANEYGVSNIRIFGSVVRGEERVNSDIDFLVHLSADRDYFDLGGFQYRSSALLNRHTDVVLDDTLNPRLAGYILQEAQTL